MNLRVHLARVDRLPYGGNHLARRLVGLPHRAYMRGGQEWIEVTDLTPRQCVGYRGLLVDRGLPESMVEVMGTQDEKAEMERIAREAEAA